MKEYKTPVIEEVNGDNTIANVFESWGYCKAYVDRALAELSQYRLTGMTPGEIAEMRRRNSAETHDGWIPVEERLPEEGQEVWISLKTECVRRGTYTKSFGDRLLEGFICAEGLVWTNAANAWKPYVVPAPYSPERRTR